MKFYDLALKCKDCSQEFLFRAGQRDYYRRKGIESIPSRCHLCRVRLWQQITGQVFESKNSGQVESLALVGVKELGARRN